MFAEALAFTVCYMYKETRKHNFSKRLKKKGKKAQNAAGYDVTNSCQTNIARNGQQRGSRNQRERAKSLNIYNGAGKNMIYQNTILLK